MLKEVTSTTAQASTSKKKIVILQVLWPYRRIMVVVKINFLDIKPMLLWYAFAIAPQNRIRRDPLIAVRSILVREHIAGVVEYNIEDHIHVAGMGFVDEPPQLLIGVLRVGGEARIDRQKV